PMWSLGVQLSFPLGMYGEKADVLEAKTRLIQSDAQASQALDQQKMNWVNSCMEFHRAQQSYQAYLEAYEKQLARARLEEERFRIGRSSMLQVIQAGDDATIAELNLRSSEVEKRLVSWQVRR